MQFSLTVHVAVVTQVWPLLLVTAARWMDRREATDHEPRLLPQPLWPTLDLLIVLP